MRLPPLSIAAFALCALTATVGATTNEKGASSGPAAGQPTKPRTFMAWKKKAAPEPEAKPVKRAGKPKAQTVADASHAPAVAVAHAPAIVHAAPAPSRVRVDWATAPVSQVEPGQVAIDWEPTTPAPAPTPAPAAPVGASVAPVTPAAAAVDGVVLPPKAVAGTSVAVAPDPPQTAKPVPPKAVQVAVVYRGRAEGGAGYAAVNGADDGYYLNRVRLEATVTATPWLRGFAQVQDAEMVGYDVSPTAPATHVNRFDLRQGYVELGRNGKAGVIARVGRQEFIFGEQRLMGGGDWNNTARAFDAARVSLFRPGVKVDAFVATVVTVTPFDVDRRRTDEFVYGGYAAFDRIVPKGVVEPYVIVKELDAVASEAGVAGTGRFYTMGARAAGKIPGGFDYSVEHAWQRGSLSTDTVDAMAGAYRLGWTPAGWPMKARFIGEFNHATGDTLAGDGRRQTFDQLYPTNHGKYGIVDVMGWRNMRDAMAGVEFMPSRRVKVNADLHRLTLATTEDGLYVDGGTRRLLNRKATNGDVGMEFDVQSTFTLTPKVAFSAGFGRLVSGDYLDRTTGGGSVWFPYAMWNVRF